MFHESTRDYFTNDYSRNNIYYVLRESRSQYEIYHHKLKKKIKINKTEYNNSNNNKKKLLLSLISVSALLNPFMWLIERSR